jgi:hypothetical protein
MNELDIRRNMEKFSDEILTKITFEAHGKWTDCIPCLAKSILNEREYKKGDKEKNARFRVGIIRADSTGEVQSIDELNLVEFLEDIDTSSLSQLTIVKE